MRRTWGAGVAALVVAAGGAAEPIDELKAEVAELRQLVAELREDRDGEQWLTRQRAGEIRGLVEDVLADAESRTSLLGQTTAGYDEGFVLASADGNWLLRTNFLMQQRFIVSSAQDGDIWGFENTRSKFTLSGNMLSPDWFYRVEINVGTGAGLLAGQPAPGLPADARSGTLDAYLGYDLGKGLRVWGGSFKAPLLREELVDAIDQQAVERSVVNYIFTTGRVDGVAIEYTLDLFRITGSYNDGSRTGQTAFGDADARFALTGRGEFLLGGTWEQFRDLTSKRGESMGILVGGGIHYQTEDPGASDLDQFTFTGDASIEFGGANLFGALMYSNQDTVGPASGNQVGLVLQGGYYLTDTWELYGRFEWASLANTGLEDTLILTAGINKYLVDQRAKWTTDMGIGVNEVRLAPPIAGFQTDAAGQDGQIVIRTQLQVAF